MKKFCSIFLMICILINFSACSQNDELYIKKEPKIGMITDYNSFVSEISKRIDLSDYDLDETDESGSYKYKNKKDIEIKGSKSNFKYEIDGKKYELPMKVSDALEKDLKIIMQGFDIAENIDLSENVYGDSLEFETKSGKTFGGYCRCEQFGYSAPLKDCIITQFAFDFRSGDSAFDKNEKLPKVEIFGGLNYDSTIDDVIRKLGSPKEIYYIPKYILQIGYEFSDKESEGSVWFSFYLLDNENENYTDILQSASIMVTPKTILEKEKEYYSSNNFNIEY